MKQLRITSLGARRGSAGFTLIEILLASTIGIIVISAALAITIPMLKTGRSSADQATLSTRLIFLRNFVTNQGELSSAGYGWAVDQDGTEVTGAWGTGYCAVTGLAACAGSLALPLRLVNSTTGPDELVYLVPRDPGVDSVQLIVPAGVDDCADVGTNPTIPTASDRGVYTWAANDLVAITKGGHVTIARVRSAFTTDGDPLTPQNLDLGFTGVEFHHSTGGRVASGACDTIIPEALHRTRVFRIKQIRIRLNGDDLELQEVRQVGAAPPFEPVMSHAVDLQFRLIVGIFPDSGSADSCTCNGTLVLNGTTTLNGGCGGGCTANDVLDRANDNGTPAYRLLGIEVGILERGTYDNPSIPAVPHGYMFDRAGTTPPSRLYHRRNTFTIGLPNVQGL